MWENPGDAASLEKSCIFGACQAIHVREEEETARRKRKRAKRDGAGVVGDDSMTAVV